ncbi:hypothetical protein GUJ93_ZPchr0007g4240 [Zizania palustris]|uniref:Uncharacterized protein n=1 Tax=Zizania palustris TaxID=103762 RepID=A0A8J5W680_ZIZPA|nr:hypothetical protein GUJ93_ZPchr0007g4240 [Zizania palustris]
MTKSCLAGTSLSRAACPGGHLPPPLQPFPLAAISLCRCSPSPAASSADPSSWPTSRRRAPCPGHSGALASIKERRDVAAVARAETDAMTDKQGRLVCPDTPTEEEERIRQHIA